jgi:hypothetical protein
MHKASWMALAGLLACGDGTIGSERCVAAVCEDPEFEVLPLLVNFREVSTLDPSPLPAPTWTIDNPCTGTCSQEDRAQLLPAGGERSWNLVRRAPVPTLELIQGDGKRATQALVAPVGASAGFGAYLAPQNDGSLLVHAQWAGSMMIDELTTLSPELPPRTSTLRPLAQRRPLGVIRGPDAFLMFDDNLVTGTLSGSLRVVGPDGALLRQRGGLPDAVAVVGGSAVWNSAQYVVTARNATAPGSSAYALAWFGPDATLLRGTTIFGSNWRGAQLYDRGQGSFVAVGPTDLEAGTGMGGANEGFIDIVEFNFENAVRGFRIMRDCFYALTLNGFAVDRSGTMFVSSLAGQRDQPRGLLCKLPVSDTPKCFQTAINQMLGALVAVSSNSVVAVLDQQIVRYDLP